MKMKEQERRTRSARAKTWHYKETVPSIKFKLSSNYSANLLQSAWFTVVKVPLHADEPQTREELATLRDHLLPVLTAARAPAVYTSLPISYHSYLICRVATDSPLSSTFTRIRDVSSHMGAVLLYIRRIPYPYQRSKGRKEILFCRENFIK